MRELGTRVTTQLTIGPSASSLPCFSPDNQKIAFTNFGSGNGDIFIMKIKVGLLKTMVTMGSNAEVFCSWSPSGKIAYTNAPSDSKRWTSEIWIYDLNTSSYSHIIDGRDLEWSPDGTKLVFYRVQQIKAWGTYTENFCSLWIINADGTGLTQITTDLSWEGHLAFGPDGKIYFDSNRTGNRDIWSAELQLDISNQNEFK